LKGQKIISKNFSNIVKDINLQICEGWKTSNRIDLVGWGDACPGLSQSS
jgi:hypothetical protein